MITGGGEKGSGDHISFYHIGGNFGASNVVCVKKFRATKSVSVYVGDTLPTCLSAQLGLAQIGFSCRQLVAGYERRSLSHVLLPIVRSH